MAGEYDDDDSGDSYDAAPVYGGAAPLAIMGQQYGTSEGHDYARKILERNIDNPQSTEEADYFQKLENQANTAREALKKARERLAAQEYGKTEMWLALAAGAGAPTRTGSLGESASNISQSLMEPIRNKRQFEASRDKDLLQLDMGLSGIDERLLNHQLQMLMAKQAREGRLTGEALKTISKPVQAQMDKNQQAGRQAADRAYVKDYIDFTQGGAASAQKSLGDLQKAIDVMKKSGNITGPIVGSVGKIPWVGDWLQSIAFPKAKNTRELVEYTIQQSLRPILGSQFTKEEGERLISRVYNDVLDEKYVIPRVEAVLGQLQKAYKQKLAAKEYFERHGTLGPTRENPRGFQAQMDFNVDDLFPPGSLPGDKETDEEDGGKPQTGYLPPVKDLPELDYESIVPAGEKLYAQGGQVHGYAEGGEAKRIAHQMPDGRVIYAPEQVPYEMVLKRYEQAVGQSFAQKPAAEEETPQEAPAPVGSEIDLDADTAVGLGGSAIGQGLLGALGGRYGMKSAHKLTDLMPGHKVSNAESRVLQGLENEGLTPSEWIKHITRAQRLGVPVTGMDTGGIELRALGEAAMHPQNPETRQVYNETLQRQEGARGRVEDQINRALKPDDYFETERKLRRDLKANSKPLYEDLAKQYPYLKSESLMQLMNTPTGKKAVKEAVKAIRDRPGATLGKTDAMGMITKPSIEFLDQVKDELDDMINREETVGGEYKPTKKGKRMRDLRNALRDEVDTLTTDPRTGVSAYKEARAQYAGDLEIRDALRLGRHDFMKKPAGELEDLIKDMNFSQKDALRTGVAQALFERTGKTGRRVNPADKIIDTPEMQEKLRLLFDKPKEYEIFKEALEAEMKLFDESKSTISRGKNVLSRPKDPNADVLTRTAKEAPTLGITSPVQWVLRYFRRKPELGKKEAAEILRILRTNDTQGLKALEANLTPKVGRMAARKGRVGKATALGAAIGAALPFARKYLEGEEGDNSEFDENTDADEETPRFAEGGLVRRPDWQRISERVINQSMFGGDDILSNLESRLE